MKIDLIKTFTSLCGINSPSGKEGDTASWIENYLRNLGLTTWRDDTGSKNSSNTGNLYGLLKSSNDFETVAFCAHMDTVSTPETKIKFDGKVFKSEGDSILGADNRAGISAVLTAIKEIDKKKLKRNILLFFPTHEEKGIMGSSFFNPGTPVKRIFNIDESSKPGNFIYKSLGYLNFKIVVNGKSAHAAKEYEKGINAIQVASVLLLKLKMGRNTKRGWTMNIGRIEGGSNTNAVCDKVTMYGELRGFNKDVMNQVLADIETKAKSVSEKFGTKIEVISDPESYIAPLDGKEKSKIADICRNACENIGLISEFGVSFSTSDANSLAGLGYEVISVARGGSNPHSFEESITVKELRDSVMLVKELMYLS